MNGQPARRRRRAAVSGTSRTLPPRRTLSTTASPSTSRDWRASQCSRVVTASLPTPSMTSVTSMRFAAGPLGSTQVTITPRLAPVAAARPGVSACA